MKLRSTTFEGSRVVPMVLAKTRSGSFQSPFAEATSSAWRPHLTGLDPPPWVRYPADVFGEGPSGGGGAEGFTGRAAIGYDHGYDGEVFYLGLALDPAYVEGFVEGCLKRMGEDNAEEERLFRNLWEDETQRGVVIESLKADCEVRTGRPSG